MKGRKPQPTQLKLVKGNPGKRAIPKNEPKIKPAAPRVPVTLSDEAKKHWKIIVKQLSDARIMTKLDSDALALYCEAYARWVDANDKIKIHGMLVKTPSGYPIQSPYLGISNKSFEQMKSIMVEFGMTPSSRTRIQAIEESDSDGDGWDGI